MCQHILGKLQEKSLRVLKPVDTSSRCPTQLKRSFQGNSHGINITDWEAWIGVVFMEVCEGTEYCQDFIPLMIYSLMIMPFADGINYLLNGYFSFHGFSPSYAS
jgi:hypothetical protein